jgi:hypothetical protein
MIALVDHTQQHRPPAGTLEAIAAALTVQINRDFAPRWGVEGATVTVNGPGDKIHFFDTAHQRGDFGFHDVDPHGQPYAHVAVAPSLHDDNTWTEGTDSVAASASHEALEMMGDPAANEWSFDGDDKLWSREVCDPVQERTYPIVANGIAVTLSDFVLPSYFNPVAPGPYDHLGILHKPFTIDKGGYAVWDRATVDHEQDGRKVVVHFDAAVSKPRQKQKLEEYGRTWWRLALAGPQSAKPPRE